MNLTPQRRWFRFRLQTLLVLVTIGSAGFGWLGFQVRQALMQKQAVEAVRKLDGIVCYDYEIDATGRHYANPSPPTPAWLRDLIGVDYVAKVVGVRIPGPTVTTETLSHLRRLNQLKFLNLGHSLVTDAGMAELQDLTHLEILSLNATPITDAGLVHLRRLTQLKDLSLGSTRITDAGLIHLQGLTQLEVLNIGGTRQTDAGLLQLKGLTRLRELYLGKNYLLNGIDGIVRVELSSRSVPLTAEPPTVTDRGCRELQKFLPNLKIGR